MIQKYRKLSTTVSFGDKRNNKYQEENPELEHECHSMIKRTDILPGHVIVKICFTIPNLILVYNCRFKILPTQHCYTNKSQSSVHKLNMCSEK